MGSQKKTLGVIAGVILAAAVVPVGSAQAMDKLRWKMPIAFPSNLPALGTPAAYAAEQLALASGGAIQIKVFEPGKLVPPFEILDAVSANKVAAGYTWIGYDQGKVPAIPMFAAVPFGLKPWGYTAWYYHGGGEKLLQEAYANKGSKVRAELCGITGPETAGWYKKPIKKLEDYKGLKIRFAGLGGKILQKLGASVTMMPGGELFQALEKGTIDATEFSMPKVDENLGFGKVVKHNLFPGWHQTFTASYMLINKGEYDKLGKDTKALIHNVCMAATLNGLSEGEYLQGDVLAGFKDKGVTPGKLPKEVLQKLKQISDQVLAEEAAADPDFKRALESQQAFQKKYQLWESNAYLSSDF